MREVKEIDDLLILIISMLVPLSSFHAFHRSTEITRESDRRGKAEDLHNVNTEMFIFLRSPLLIQYAMQSRSNYFFFIFTFFLFGMIQTI